MKTLMRILVLVFFALLLMVVGFWLGTRWQPEPGEDPVAELTTQVASQPEAAGPGAAEPPGALQAAPDQLKDTGPKVSPPEGTPAVPKTPDAATGPGPALKPDASPKPPGTTAEPPAAAPAGEKAMTPETAPGAPATPAPATASVSPVAATAPPAAAPAAPAPPSGDAPAAAPVATAAPTPASQTGEKKKGEPPPIITPEDLGKNNLFYSIQAGAFLDRELAQTRLNELQTKQYPAYLVSAWDDKQQLWHTVRVGRYTDLTEARLAARALGDKERIDAYVYGIGSLRYDELPEPEPPAAPAPPAEASSAPETQAGLKEP